MEGRKPSRSSVPSILGQSQGPISNDSFTLLPSPVSAQRQAGRAVVLQAIHEMRWFSQLGFLVAPQNLGDFDKLHMLFLISRLCVLPCVKRIK